MRLRYFAKEVVLYECYFRNLFINASISLRTPSKNGPGAVLFKKVIIYVPFNYRCVYIYIKYGSLGAKVYVFKGYGSVEVHFSDSVNQDPLRFDLL